MSEFQRQQILVEYRHQHFFPKLRVLTQQNCLGEILLILPPSPDPKRFSIFLVYLSTYISEEECFWNEKEIVKRWSWVMAREYFPYMEYA